MENKNDWIRLSVSWKDVFSPTLGYSSSSDNQWRRTEKRKSEEEK